ncbi:MAG TPA: hypothetical protein VM689_16795 [Aliidongia sp.]|nr:hypothetical protein [Aliidongia sp.]
MSLMGRIVLALVLVLVVCLIGGFAFLAFWDVPAPVEKVEKVLPDARFPK